ncbi:SCO-spondin-like isoform X3 [Dreissena polymorpha]|uniref:SCO-spondin-like isoform X3 n=1 Tax=Dreissena polymorpha TaxID=45954 RepID=UPI002264C0CA|nr:SCO-spondin-like isoform X3 [Dreissena polymorpha]
MRQFLAVLVFAGCLIHGALGAIYCTIADDTPVFSAPDLGIRVVTLVERNTCFNGDMEGEWLVLQDNPIYNIHRYAVIEDIEPAADKNEANGYREYDPWYKQSVRSRCVDVEGINTCAGVRSIPNYRQEKRFLLGDATWTNWIEWSECNSSCNVEGTRNRTRECFVLNPNVQANCNGGDSIQLQKCTKSCLVTCSDGFSWTVWHDCTKTCDGITTRSGGCWNGTANVTTTEEKNCTRELCPVDGTWSDWGQWGSCSATMNLAPGIRFRFKQCLPTNRHGGADCPGKPYDTGVCMGSDWEEWSSWTKCTSTNCSKGLTVRIRYCKIQNCTGAEFEEKDCYLNDCPINGAWGAWEGWTVCKCNGLRGRFRNCDSPPPTNGGQDCQDSRYEVGVCNKTSNCSVDGSWGAWEGWSVCYCSGFRPRYRKCDSPPPLTGGQYCNGSEFELSMCNRTSNTNCPVDGKWTDWSVWSTCSVSCENGTQSRNRNCTNPPQAYGGKDCGSDDSAFQNCSISIPCPVAGGWSTWSDWSSCSATCQAPGLQYRNRSCDSPTPDNGGQNCTGGVGDMRNCHGTGPCPVDGGYSNWLQWFDCSATCEGGVRYRSRYCNEPRPQNGGSDCSVLGKSSETQSCNIQPCPVDGNWGLWSNWSRCDVTCGNGKRTRNRPCEGIAYGGQNCSGDALQTETCREVVCPVSGAWGQWEDWLVCNCNSTQTRVRKCDSPAPLGSGLQCLGSTRETVSCSDKPTTCPVDGHWGSWYPWVACSTTCGPGEMVRVRSCNNPRPQNGGLYCDSDEKGEDERKGCQGPPCQINGSWSDWTAWSTCSVTCGIGSHSRNRSCDHPAPAYGGVNCAGSDNENGSCTQKHCPIDGNWSGWSAWFACDVTCATGTRHRVRTCDSPAPNYGGQPCNETAAQFEQCQEPPCPIDGIWGAWQSWTMCSVTCLNGIRSRTRLCDSPTPQHGGSDCKEQQNGTETCTMRDNCDVDGGWTEWGFWSFCDVSCASGHHTRYRLCENPPPEYFGKYCEGPDSEVGECFDKPCPIDGRFGAWMAWGSCFPSTGNGLKTRTRLCDNPQPMNGGRNCQGNYTEQLQCCDSDCPDKNTCTFDAPLNCIWHNVDLLDNMDWIVFNGSTNTDDTGPSSDHTFGNSTGRYVYLESSAPSKECDKAWYQSGIIQPGFNAPACVQFWYHMHGADIGSLNIYMATGSQLPGKLLWTVSGNQGDVWKSGHVPLSYSSNISILAEATVGNGYHGDIGLDDLLFTQSTCSLYPSMANTQSAATCPTTTISPGHWSSWFNGQCSVTCGNGTLTRMRHCSSGHTEDCAGTSSEVIGCQKPPCGAWSAWFNGQCSVTCGNGTLTRMRHCSTGHSEDCVGNSREVIDCKKTPCKVDGVWSSWSLWAQCDVTCEDGHIYRTRMCSNPPPAFGGLNCSGASQEANTCRLARCPDWSPWFNGKCSVTCGNGTETRVRNCSTGYKEDCAGKSSEVVGCQMAPCEVNGTWSSWSTWSQCDVTCEDGHIQRTRTCTNPAPAFGGLNCSGESLETSACKLAKCPSWSEWFLGDCSVTCGDGTLSRMRMCSSGHDEDCPGSAFDTVPCSQAPC